ncbi:MAG: hypothetical protein NC427_02340 [Ruminococcus flavefaciens]|nr:hypothetical protein [Ruminococcus flavefaciens]MCM1432312.1 hypothetical protein [Muribaculaceae bacterium]
MEQQIEVTFVDVRKYIRIDRETGRSEIVSVSNRNRLSVERHLELLNLNDEDHCYLEYISQDDEL